MVVSCYVAYAAVGWFLSGLGSALPDLEDDIGDRAGAYPLLPGVVLLVWGVAYARRHRAAEPVSPHASVIVTGCAGLAVAVAVTGLTRWTWVSITGMVGAAVAATALIRLLPAVLSTERPDDTERVMVRANAWSSLAGVTAPIAIGLAIGLGVGWLPGMALPIAFAAAFVALRVGRAPVADAASVEAEPVEEEGVEQLAAVAVPPLRTWWREWLVLTVCIGVEFCFAYFVATFLHDELGVSTAIAATGGAAWGVGMAGGRFALSTVTPPRSVLPSVAVIAVGFLLLWAPGSTPLAVIGICVAGVGTSPLYPMRATALLARFPASPDQGAVRGSIASGSALVLAPALMAGLRALSDVRTAYLAVPALLVVLVVLARPVPPVVGRPAVGSVPPIAPDPAVGPEIPPT